MANKILRAEALAAAIFLTAFDMAAIATPAPSPVPDKARSGLWAATVAGNTAPVAFARTNDKPFCDPPYGQDVCYHGGEYAFMQFESDSWPVDVEVETLSPRDLSRVRILPESTPASIKAIGGRTVSISVAAPCKFSIEPDGRESPVLVFAERPLDNPPDTSDPRVRSFGPGFHDAGGIVLRSGETLFLKAGAFVKGTIRASGDDVRICGHGVLDCTDYEWRETPFGSGEFMMALMGCRNASIEGITIRGASHWSIVPLGCNGVSIRDVKICGGRVWCDDGIDPCNSKNVLIEDCFIRTDDDCIAVKGIRRSESAGAVENVDVRRCVLWSDRARPVLIGHENRAPAMRELLFEDCDIIRSRPSAFCFEPGREMRLENVAIRNCRVHDDLGFGIFRAIWFRPFNSQPTMDNSFGYIDGIAVENLSVKAKQGDYPPFEVHGADKSHLSRNIKFSNVTFNGEPLRKGSPLLEIGGFTESVEVEAEAVKCAAPIVTFGVISDTHVSQDPASAEPLAAALAFFYREGVDAVVCAGDITENGTLAELAVAKRVWDTVFPRGCNALGMPVAPVFVFGNHDYLDASSMRGRKFTDAEKAESILYNKDAAWRMFFGEPFPGEVFARTIRGVPFVSAHWKSEAQGGEFLLAHKAEFPEELPAIFVQHPHPRGTVFGTWVPQDDGRNRSALEAIPNLLVISGHSHQTITDDRALWRESFASLAAGSLRLPKFRRDLAEYSLSNEALDHMRGAWQSSIVTVWPNRIVIRRVDVRRGESLGVMWELPFETNGLFKYETRRAGETKTGITLVEPVDGATVPILKSAQRDFLSLQAEECRTMFAERDSRLEWAKVGGRPAKVRFSWESDFPKGTRFRITVQRRDGTPFVTATTESRSISLCNFESGEEYEWRVVAEDEGRKNIPKEPPRYIFRTAPETPRCIRIEHVRNTRDIGGHVGLGGRRIRQGRIFRSAAMNDKTAPATGREGKSFLSNEGITSAVKDLGIKTDLDLRNDEETAGMVGSPLGQSVHWMHIPAECYAELAKERGKTAFANCFRVFLDEANYPVLIHCVAGADRTGSLAFVLEALLGVEESVLWGDWAFTALSHAKETFQPARYDALLAFLARFPGDTLCEQAENYAKSCGFSGADIAKFRSLMLE